MKLFAVRLMLLTVIVLLFLAPPALAAGPVAAPPAVTLTPEQLASIAGAVLALVFAYLPWVKDWYDRLPSQYKPLVMLGLLVVVSIGIFAATCGSIISVGITCDKNGALALLYILLAAIVGNQGTYMIAVRPYKK